MNTGHKTIVAMLAVVAVLLAVNTASDRGTLNVSATAAPPPPATPLGSDCSGPPVFDVVAIPLTDWLPPNTDTCYGSLSSLPSHIDIDGDGIEELYAGRETSYFYRVTEAGLEVVGSYSVREELEFPDPPGEEVCNFFTGFDIFFDVDGDGLLDLILNISYRDCEGSEVAKRVFYFRNILPPPLAPCDADIDNNGNVEFDDLLRVLDALGTVRVNWRNR